MVLTAADLAVREVTVSFGGITALDGVSVEVSTGEVVGVIGPNGAGKTTLFNVICGFVSPQSGTLRWGGRALHGVRPDRLASFGVARTLQGVGLFGQLSVLENVMAGADRFRRSRYGGALLGLWTSDRDERRLRDRARETLARLDCEGDRGPAAGDAAVRRPEARGAGPSAGLRSQAAAARRARGRPRRRRADRARRGDQIARAVDRGDGRRASHGPGDVGLRPGCGARLRPRDRRRRARRDPGGPAGDGGLPRPRRRGRHRGRRNAAGAADADR